MQRKISYMVVSYFNSTSNHNSSHIHRTNRRVVSYFNSTSNHNNRKKDMLRDWLFLISILHQTTTIARVRISMKSLFLISILHQTTTSFISSETKPVLFLISILHQTTTSDMRFVDCHSVIWPNERYERRMTGRGSRNDAGFVFQRYFSLKVECTSRARNRYMFAK